MTALRTSARPASVIVLAVSRFPHNAASTSGERRLCGHATKCQPDVSDSVAAHPAVRRTLPVVSEALLNSASP
ncbi:hypothetical protein DMH04_27060 [Kibdelosporangium aridum]|uniref:Uncharacterized protein n=1 Tax=Kibdelosporangium aridum TaxID=2030 RepID=A0A428Z595_KIBAR|nr:hypothetical protein DMH04_27060 [Kibdelosporangium aridum]